MFIAQSQFVLLFSILPPQVVAQARAFSRWVSRMWMLLLRFGRDNRGQDLVEYALIVAFAVGVVAVLTALYATIKNVLTKANTSLQSAAGQ